MFIAFEWNPITLLFKQIMKMISILQAHGNKKDAISIGDIVLIEGTDSSNGTFIIRGEIESINGDMARVTEKDKFFISGYSVKVETIDSYEISDLKRSIFDRLKENSEFEQWFAKEMTK